MGDKQVRRIPVVDEQNRPIGVLSLNAACDSGRNPFWTLGDERRHDPRLQPRTRDEYLARQVATASGAGHVGCTAIGHGLESVAGSLLDVRRDALLGLAQDANEAPAALSRRRAARACRAAECNPCVRRPATQDARLERNGAHRASRPGSGPQREGARRCRSSRATSNGGRSCNRATNPPGILPRRDPSLGPRSTASCPGR